MPDVVMAGRRFSGRFQHQATPHGKNLPAEPVGDHTQRPFGAFSMTAMATAPRISR
jgi:hypothetical protein